MRDTYGGDGHNRHGGYHSRDRKTPNEGHGGGGQRDGKRVEGTDHHMGSGERSAGHKTMKEPTNHAGHTYGGNAAHDARVNATRSLHTGSAGGQHGHEKILHETHKLHQRPGAHYSHGSKHGESHHIREGGGGHVKETGKELD